MRREVVTRSVTTVVQAARLYKSRRAACTTVITQRDDYTGRCRLLIML